MILLTLELFSFVLTFFDFDILNIFLPGKNSRFSIEWYFRAMAACCAVSLAAFVTMLFGPWAKKVRNAHKHIPNKKLHHFLLVTMLLDHKPPLKGEKWEVNFS